SKFFYHNWLTFLLARWLSFLLTKALSLSQITKVAIISEVDGISCLLGDIRYIFRNKFSVTCY
ncbi:hypothetical protein, partial [uncultured Ruminococcus sp.]